MRFQTTDPAAQPSAVFYNCCTIDLRTGKKPSGSRGLDSYRVKIVDGDIFVQAIPKELNW